MFELQVRAVRFVEIFTHSYQQCFQVVNTQNEATITYLFSMMTCY